MKESLFPNFAAVAYCRIRLLNLFLKKQRSEERKFKNDYHEPFWNRNGCKQEFLIVNEN